jgi:hypothetical protein
MAEEGELRVYNPNKEISKEIVLDVIVRYRDYSKQADTGEPNNMPPENINHKDKKMNQVRGLNLMILTLKQMITISRSLIYDNSRQYWLKRNKSPEEQEKNPFEKFETDYKELMEWLDVLKRCQMEIINAEKTKTLEDDFILTKHGEDGEYMELTGNFYEMRDDLDSIYSKVYLLMMRNKIVSSGKEEDEELTDKQKEEEMMKRIVEA